MTTDLPDSALELRSTVTSHGTLELSLQDVPVPTPAANEVVVGWRPRRSTRRTWVCCSGRGHDHGRSRDGDAQSARHRREMRPGGSLDRVDKPLPVGNEGAGTVVAAGVGPAQALVGTRWRSPAARCGRDTEWSTPPRAWSCPTSSTRRRCVIVRQSADRARNARNDAPREPHRLGAHRRGVQSRPDAREDLRGRRRAAGEHRAQGRAGGAAAFARRGACQRLLLGRLSPSS